MKAWLQNGQLRSLARGMFLPGVASAAAVEESAMVNGKLGTEERLRAGVA